MAKKYKHLTQREKAIRKEARDELRAEGIIPPAKPKLNRKKFVIETLQESNEIGFLEPFHLYDAISCMIPTVFAGERVIGKITSEQIGAVKVLKIAMEKQKFLKEKSGSIDGETYLEWVENVVIPIINL